ncbi:lysophospholipase catalytic domain-containing protein [Phlyctochytrium arcticum]|nr:lysophospholipase catalytic domain-containing protein [Phlyctochytrium arcticum]
MFSHEGKPRPRRGSHVELASSSQVSSNFTRVLMAAGIVVGILGLTVGFATGAPSPVLTRRQSRHPIINDPTKHELLHRVHARQNNATTVNQAGSLPIPTTYAPAYVNCPATPIVRAGVENGPSNTRETQWTAKRDTVVKSVWDGLPHPAGASNDTALPRVAIAVSGGGYRAMLYGASILAPMSLATPPLNTSTPSPAAGIFDVATYIAGLSGGSWLLASLYTTQPFPLFTAQNLTAVWSLTEDLAKPGGLIDSAKVYADIIGDVKDKKEAGFPVSLTDIWSRLVGLHLNPGGKTEIEDGDVRSTPPWSSVAVKAQNVVDAAVPFPIVAAVQRTEGEDRVTVMARIWESTPFETGSFNEEIDAFIDTKYYGTFTVNGTPQHQQNQSANNVTSNPPCVVNFDQTEFIVGTSSSLFNLQVQLIGGSTLLEPLSSYLSETGLDTARIPNPFHNLTSVQDNGTRTADILELVDGGESGQNIPLWPLLHPSREVDIIFAIDGSNDMNGYPNGTALIITGQYVTDWITNPNITNHTADPNAPKIQFPPIPDTPETIVYQGLDKRTTVFGCAALANNNGGGAADYDGPVIVYIPNREVAYPTNTSTFQFEYSDEEVAGFFKNGAAIMQSNPVNTTASQNTTVPEWSTCLSCILRTTTYRGAPTSSVPVDCQSCFKAHCWDGSNVGTPPNTPKGVPATRNWTGVGPPPTIPTGFTSGASSGGASDALGRFVLVLLAALYQILGTHR